MKIFVEITRFAGRATSAELRDRVRALEDVGASGVNVWDHLFAGPGPRAESAMRPCDPLTTLAAVAGISDRLILQSCVVNSGWIHPALLLRQFSQLASLVGGDRVVAGLGTGWSTDEFDALGIELPRFRPRMNRLEETLQIARGLYDHGVADVEGRYVAARQLPVSPVPKGPPKLLIGGGSDAAMRLAGRYTDLIDLHASPAKGKMVGNTSEEKDLADRRRRMLTTVEDLEERMGLVWASAQEAGREPAAVTASVHIGHVIPGSPAEVAEAEVRICRDWGRIPDQPMANNPYILLGSDQQMIEALLERAERFGLHHVIIKEDPDPEEHVDLGLAPIDALEVCRRLSPLL
jgi:alkanesulfonate monooxygenase SsuD/methylene tetrahydromethanopterin reductase-like flavin-dependent oxidoreductase (luciferase family)